MTRPNNSSPTATSRAAAGGDHLAADLDALQVAEWHEQHALLGESHDLGERHAAPAARVDLADLADARIGPRGLQREPDEPHDAPDAPHPVAGADPLANAATGRGSCARRFTPGLLAGGAQRGAQLRELHFEPAVEAAERGLDHAAARFHAPVADQREAAARQAAAMPASARPQHRQVRGFTWMRSSRSSRTRLSTSLTPPTMASRVASAARRA